MGTEVYGPNGTVVGTVVDGTLVLPRLFSKHFFLKFQGYGISMSVCEQAADLGARKVLIVETHKGKVTRFEAPLDAFTQSALRWTLVLRDGTRDEQRFVRRKAMRIV